MRGIAYGFNNMNFELRLDGPKQTNHLLNFKSHITYLALKIKKYIMYLAFFRQEHLSDEAASDPTSDECVTFPGPSGESSLSPKAAAKKPAKKPTRKPATNPTKKPATAKSKAKAKAKPMAAKPKKKNTPKRKAKAKPSRKRDFDDVEKKLHSATYPQTVF